MTALLARLTSLCSSQNIPPSLPSLLEYNDLISYGCLHWNALPSSPMLVHAIFVTFNEKSPFGSTPNPIQMHTAVSKSLGFLMAQCREGASLQATSQQSRLATRVIVKPAPFPTDPISNKHQSRFVVPLRAIAVVLFENSVYCTELHDELMELLVPIAQTSTHLNSRRLAIICLGNICAKAGTRLLPFLRTACSALVNIVLGASAAHPHILTQALRSLQIIFNENKLVACEAASVLCPALSSFMGSSASEKFTWKAAGGQEPWRKPIDSDSEISDSDSLGPRQFRLFDTKLRIAALQLLALLAKSCPKQVFPHLSSIIISSEDPTCVPLVDSIVLSLDPKLRIAASATLSTLFDNAKPFFALAAHSETKQVSFTPLSQRLANNIYAINSSLLAKIVTESQPFTLCLLLQTLTSLVRCTPYTRLAHDFRAEILTRLDFLILHTDLAVRARAVECFSALLDTTQDLESDPSINIFLDATPGRLWDVALGDVILRARQDMDTATRLASVKILEQFANSCCTKQLPSKDIPPNWWQTVSLMVAGPLVLDRMFAVRAMALNIIGQIPFSEMGDLKTRTCEMCWQASERLINDEHSDVRSAAWGALGVLLGEASQYQDISHLQHLSSLIVVCGNSETNVATKVRAAWTLGNLAEALGTRFETVGDSAVVMNPGQICLLLKTANSFTADNEKCRANGVRAISSVAKLIFESKQVDAIVLQILMAESTRLAIKTSQSGSFKARWNACYCLGILLSSPYKDCNEMAWRTPIFNALVHAATGCSNFKVKISAITAMRSANRLDAEVNSLPLTAMTGIAIPSSIPTPPTHHLRLCLDAILNTLDTMDESVSGSKFGEFRYMDQLKQAALVTTEHLQHIRWSPVDGATDCSSVTPPLGSEIQLEHTSWDNVAIKIQLYCSTLLCSSDSSGAQCLIAQETPR
ncbi:hypothetical protein BSLG_004740 [Batrachochytrium salamandrivorans]|nr:hypothetical protein BSLG_004740 [Batrachochytrium salamandrivorans]